MMKGLVMDANRNYNECRNNNAEDDTRSQPTDQYDLDNQHRHPVNADSSDYKIRGFAINQDNPRPHREAESCCLKLDILAFSGRVSIEEFLDRLYEVKKFFEMMNVPDEKRVKLVTYQLRRGVAAWWDNMQIKPKASQGACENLRKDEKIVER